MSKKDHQLNQALYSDGYMDDQVTVTPTEYVLTMVAPTFQKNFSSHFPWLESSAILSAR